MAALQRGGWLALFRTLAPAPPDSDADLLARFVTTRDEAALDALIRRYAGMVMGVCRRRLGDTPDADDAFQATFLVLAQKAGSVSRGASLPAWLHRVASLTSLKLAGRLHRRGTAPMDADVPDPRPDSPHAAGERNEVSAALDDEIAALAEKFRGPVVLCYLEGKTNAEAATTLGIPVGTVDSRLHSAKATLRARLTRRGFAGAALATGIPAGVGASDELIRSTVRAALAYSAGSSLAAPAVTTLAREVSSAMTTFKFKLLAAAAMVATLAGGLGTGVYFAQAGGDPQAKAKPDPKAPPAKPTSIPGTGNVDGTGEAVRVETSVKAPGTTAATTAILSKDAGFDAPLTVQIGELFEQLSKVHGATFRIENVPGLKQMGIDNPYERTVELRFTKGLSVQDVLDEVVNSLTPNEKTLGFRVKGNQVLLGKVFVPPTSPSAFARADDQIPQAITPEDVYRMLYGPTVSLAAKDQTLAEIIDALREQTGANIVLNGLAEVELDRKVTVTLNDTKLFTVLKVVGDMYGLAPAAVDNVFYVTSPDKAEKMNRETAKALFGDPEADAARAAERAKANPAAKAEPGKPK